MRNWQIYTVHMLPDMPAYAIYIDPSVMTNAN